MLATSQVARRPDPLTANPGALAPQALSATPPSFQHTIKYDYDSLYRLTSANYCWGYVAARPVSNAYRDYNYGYDLMGNRTQAQAWVNGQEAQNVAYFYNPANQLDYSTDYLTNQTTNYNYDLAGRLTSYGSVSLQWDAENRLTTYTEPGRTTAYAYTGYGDRYQQTVNGIETSYVLDYATGLTQVLAETTNSQATNYLTGVGQQQGPIWSYYNADGLGSVRQMTDASGAVTYRASYEPYGTPFEQWPNPQAAATVGFTGEQTDANDLIYLRARYYDPYRHGTSR
jgi:YD repeat-containing protein